MGTVSVPIDISAARPDSTNTPELVFIAGTNFPQAGYAFPQSSSKAIYLQFRSLQYGSGNLTLVLRSYSRSGSTTGTVTWTAALAAVSSGDAVSLEAKSFATSQNASSTVNSTAKGDTSTSITISNLDSLANGDDVWIKVTRTDTSVTGDMILIGGDLSWSDGNSGTAGSGDLVGPASATDTAIMLFDTTTGKLAKNSAITVDGSGNMSGVGTINSAWIPSFVRLSSAFTSSGTAQQDITGTSITVPAAGTYVFEYYLSTANSSTTGTLSFAATATGGTISGYSLLVTNPTNTTVFLAGTSTTNGTAATGGVRATATALPVTLTGSFVCTSSGTLVARVTMSANTCTVAVGSWGRLTRIA